MDQHVTWARHGPTSADLGPEGQERQRELQDALQVLVKDTSPASPVPPPENEAGAQRASEVVSCSILVG